MLSRGAVADPVGVGYGTQPRSHSNVAVATINDDDLRGQAVTTWEQLIVGESPASKSSAASRG